MSTYQVGQMVRVRFAYTAAGQPYVGRQAVITEAFDFISATGYGLDCAPIQWDGEGFAAWTAEQLEPWKPTGAAPSELSYTELMDRLKAGEGVPA